MSLRVSFKKVPLKSEGSNNYKKSSSNKHFSFNPSETQSAKEIRDYLVLQQAVIAMLNCMYFLACFVFAAPWKPIMKDAIIQIDMSSTRLFSVWLFMQSIML